MATPVDIPGLPLVRTYVRRTKTFGRRHANGLLNLKGNFQWRNGRAPQRFFLALMPLVISKYGLAA